VSAPPTDPWLLNDAVLSGQLVGYGLSVTLALLLMAVVWKYPGNGRSARLLFAACGAAWSFGGLARFALQAAGFDESAALVAWVQTLTFSAAAAWPISVCLLWEGNTRLSARELAAGTWLVRIAAVTAVALIVALVVAAFRGTDASPLRPLVAYNAAMILTAGAVLVYRHLRSITERVAVALIVVGPLLTIAVHVLQEVAGRAQAEPLLEVLSKQSILLTILGGLVYLGRFRGVDRFAKVGLRIALAWILALTVAWLIFGPMAQLSMRSVAPTAVSLALAAALIAMAAFGFVVSARASDSWVDRRVFGRTDPIAALAILRERLSREETLTSVLAAAERFVHETLGVNVRVASGASTDVGIEEGGPRMASPAVETFPVRVGDAEPLALVLEPHERRLLVTAEMDLVRQCAELIGRRLEGLERESDRHERSRREASLVHQLVAAELRALRAQINPHFLFNSLNTIAALVHDDPALAERMTVRLARIFRHVLTQSERQFSSVTEEIDFLRAYLDIEQIRFGKRLHIDFRVADAVAETQVPSLILQPLVENAIKHGLSPKVGECRLTISGVREGEHVVLSVEDDGVGVRDGTRNEAATSTGIGLRNVRDRLRTLYGERGRLLFESRARLGSRAAVYVPLGVPS
jgi:two-component system LytT family sensor kinase